MRELFQLFLDNFNEASSHTGYNKLRLSITFPQTHLFTEKFSETMNIHRVFSLVGGLSSPTNAKSSRDQFKQKRFGKT